MQKLAQTSAQHKTTKHICCCRLCCAAAAAAAVAVAQLLLPLLYLQRLLFPKRLLPLQLPQQLHEQRNSDPRAGLAMPTLWQQHTKKTPLMQL
jgi:hypothetical protein